MKDIYTVVNCKRAFMLVIRIANRDLKLFLENITVWANFFKKYGITYERLYGNDTFVYDNMRLTINNSYCELTGPLNIDIA